MTLTTLDPVTALVVIDLQKGVLGLATAHPSADVLHNAATLADAFRRQGLPVVLVNVTGGAPGRTQAPPRGGDRPADWADLAPELGLQQSDVTITKRTWGAWQDTTLDDELRARGVTQVVVAGISTSIGVESTARGAHERGYNVTLAVDAMTDGNADAHENSVTRIFPRLGETGTTAEVVALLDAR